MNRVKILFFASLRDKAGAKQIELTLADDANVRDLKDQLGSEYPNLKQSLATVLVAINREYAFDGNRIPAGAEIGLFPPVSGG